MNEELLRKLKNQTAQVRIGGKGTPRRKKKVVHTHSSAATDDKKLQSSLKKMSANIILDIDEANMIKDDGTVIHFNNPKVQASFTANTFAISGHGEVKQIPELLPGILHHLGPDGVTTLRRIASQITSHLSPDEDNFIPDLKVNFAEASKEEET